MHNKLLLKKAGGKGWVRKEGVGNARILLAQLSQLIPKPQEQPWPLPSLLKDLVGAP